MTLTMQAFRIRVDVRFRLGIAIAIRRGYPLPDQNGKPRSIWRTKFCFEACGPVYFKRFTKSVFELSDGAKANRWCWGWFGVSWPLRSHE